MRKHTYIAMLTRIAALDLPPAVYEQQVAALQSQIRPKTKDANSQPPRRNEWSRSKYMPHQGRQECARRLLPNYDRERRLQAFIDAIPDDARSSLDALI